MKVLIVHTLYTDEETMKTIMLRLVEHCISFHFTGEFIYSDSSLEAFVEEFCKDLGDARITYDVERWADDCLNFDSDSTDEQINLYEDGQLVGQVLTSPYMREKVSAWLSKLCRFAAFHGVNAQFGSK